MDDPGGRAHTVHPMMLPLGFIVPSDRPIRVLCVGAHCDDIEIGCGGTLLHLLAGVEAEVTWAILSSSEERATEARSSADAYLGSVERKSVVLGSFRDGFLPYRAEQIKAWFEDVRSRFDPDLIFTHRGADAHQDHRIAHELTWNTFRNHTVMEYEIPKYEGDLGDPNLYVPLDESTCRLKAELLIEHYRSQRTKHWFTVETFLALLRIRGIECRSPSGYAEAFHCPKLVLGEPGQAGPLLT